MDAATVVLRGCRDADTINITAQAREHDIPMTTLWHRNNGRPCIRNRAPTQQYLAPPEEKALANFLIRMANHGTPVQIKFLPLLAFSIARRRSTNKALKPPKKKWSQAFSKRHPELKSRRVKPIDWNRHDNNIYEKIVDWFEVIGEVLQDPQMQPQNVYNMDETGVMLSLPCSVKVLVGKDDARKYRGARVKRTTVTAVECISGDGRYLDPMIIWPASTHRADWSTYPTPGWHYACSESGYTDSEISFEWLRRVFDPQTKERANGKPRVLICDGFGTHQTLDILEFCFENDIVLCRLPSHTSHKLQPCDVAVFAPLKAAYRDEVDRLERGGVNTVGKAHFTCLYDPARKRAFTEKNILAGWAKSGLFPFNPDRVLRDAPKPETTTTPISCRSHTTPGQENDAVPATPITPVTTEALLSIQARITDEASALDAKSKRRLEKHVQKLANAASTSFAEQELQKEHIRFLYSVNDEAKVRRATKSVVLGKAKVMRYEDLVQAREKRSEKERLSATKKKRGRKGKILTLVADRQQQVAPVARMI